VSLQLLRIRNLAIIEETELEFGSGLNVITGETGAGKSILIASLALVLGGRADAGLVRTGASRAEVEALFGLGAVPALRALLAEHDIEVEDELVIRRVLLKSGRSRAYVGGRLTPLHLLRQLARGLVDISSQHEHHTLVDARTHIDHLDAFAHLNGTRAQVSAAHLVLQEASKALRLAEDALRARAEREDLLRFQLSEFNALEPQADELDGLEGQVQKLRHAADLAEIASRAERTLYRSDKSIVSGLARVTGRLEQAVRHDPVFSELVDRLDSARMEVEEVARDLQRYGAELPLEPRALASAEERLQAVRRLIRKHGHTIDDLIAWGQSARDELDHLGAGEARVEALAVSLDTARKQARDAAFALSRDRHAAAEPLANAMTAELASLGMGGARVMVDVAPIEGEGGLSLEGRRLTARGIDRVEFLIAPNPGEDPRPLARVASGGELSRALLALKRVLSGIGPVGLFVFDEVDTGVGGAVAEVIGQKLATIACGNQVLCITHSPQVAVYAHQHYFVHKVHEGGRTHSRIRRLDEAEHLSEVSRMLGGIDVSEASKAAARQLRTTALAARAPSPV
jgi:DNA repair protein RecN (Recombination protein N)